MSNPAQWIWLTAALPLAAAAAILALPRKSGRVASTIAIAALSVSTLLALASLVTAVNSGGEVSSWNFEWFQTASGPMRIGFICDPLSSAMLAMVCFVSLLIFIYSVGYMAHDERFASFFAKLSFFVASMAGLVISSGLFGLFIFWELVGLASYLLIGFWFHKPSAAAAAKKAFITTRIGDIGFLLGMVWLYRESGTLLFFDGGSGILEPAQITRLQGVATEFMGWSLAGTIGLLLFCGPIGKSGQFPLHVWLPDAMEGPTPVSALIHAATMVAAGVFLMARLYPMMAGTEVLSLVAWLGAFTALFAATIAVAQNDIKRILAYSTVSQLGFMMLAIGCGNPGAAMLHLLSHAFFKALLFLGAGSVIHGCHEEQNVMKMGGLRQTMPVTWWTYAAGFAALSGVPLSSGFFSKDAILASMTGAKMVLVPVALSAAFLTAFYMTRQVCLVFFGRGRHTGQHHAVVHESPLVMLVPLGLLAIFCLPVFGSGSALASWITGSHDAHSGHAVWVMITSGLIAAAGIGAGWWVYGRAPLLAGDSDPLTKWLGVAHTVLRDRFYVDQVYAMILGAVLKIAGAIVSFCEWAADRLTDLGAAGVDKLGQATGRVGDDGVINPAFDLGCRAVSGGGLRASRLRSGLLPSYLRFASAGIVAAAMAYIFWR